MEKRIVVVEYDECNICVFYHLADTPDGKYRWEAFTFGFAPNKSFHSEQAAIDWLVHTFVEGNSKVLEVHLE